MEASHDVMCVCVDVCVCVAQVRMRHDAGRWCVLAQMCWAMPLMLLQLVWLVDMCTLHLAALLGLFVEALLHHHVTRVRHLVVDS